MLISYQMTLYAYYTQYKSNIQLQMQRLPIFDMKIYVHFLCIIDE